MLTCVHTAAMSLAEAALLPAQENPPAPQPAKTWEHALLHAPGIVLPGAALVRCTRRKSSQVMCCTFFRHVL